MEYYVQVKIQVYIHAKQESYRHMMYLHDIVFRLIQHIALELDKFYSEIMVTRLKMIVHDE